MTYDTYVITNGGYSTVENAEMAIRTLGNFIGGVNEEVPGKPLDEVSRMGVGYILSLISADIRNQVFENARIFDADTMQKGKTLEKSPGTRQ